MDEAGPWGEYTECPACRHPTLLVSVCGHGADEVCTTCGYGGSGQDYGGGRTDET